MSWDRSFADPHRITGQEPDHVARSRALHHQIAEGGTRCRRMAGRDGGAVAADRWPMLIDQCSGLFERAIEEIEKLPGAFALQRNVLAFHDRFTPTSQLQLE